MTKGNEMRQTKRFGSQTGSDRIRDDAIWL